ncbi:MAG: dihydrofolate reductase family protein [Chloroflexi bacterium]|nr:dihydrofolate reductase family protein [Chloroflexota bacterium]
MRKIVMLNRVSLDGYFAGIDGEIDWFIHDPEVDAAAHEMMNPDTILFGSRTYQMFENYWPAVGKDPSAPQEARRIARELDEMNKVVFSKSTLEDVTWMNSRLVKDGVVQTVKELKQGEGPDITIFGSGTIVQQLTDARLVDEYILIMTPVVLGAGKRLFSDGTSLSLELVETRSFASGNVLLRYRV